jgi:hypothetical protein
VTGKKLVINMDKTTGTKGEVLDKLHKSDGVLALFSLFVQYVNRNVGILNKNVASENDIQVTDHQTSYGKQLGLKLAIFKKPGAVSQIAGPVLGHIGTSMFRSRTPQLHHYYNPIGVAVPSVFGGRRLSGGAGEDIFKTMPRLATINLI